MHHFAGLPLGAVARVYLGIIHQSFSRPESQGPLEREERVEVASLQYPLCGPWQHLLMRDATHTLMCSLLAHLSAPLSSSLPLSSCRQSTQAVHQGMPLSPPSLQLLFCLLIPSCFICLRIPHLHSPTPPSLLLSSPRSLTSLSCFHTQHTLQKTAIKQTFLLVTLRSGSAQWLYGIYTKYKICSSLQQL